MVGGCVTEQTLQLHLWPLSHLTDPPMTSHLEQLPERGVTETCGRCPLRHQGNQLPRGPTTMCLSDGSSCYKSLPVRAIIQSIFQNHCSQQTLPQNSLINWVPFHDALGSWFEEVFQNPRLLSFLPCATLDHSVVSSISGGSRSDLSLHSEIAPDHRSHGVLPGGD